jgi:ATP-binding protein involved in chromosome partitioning
LEVPRTLPTDGKLPGVRNAVAVASAKGGVGKSTVCVNLALALARAGNRVGLLDADIYGPSIPLMMGIRRQPEMGEDQKMIPIEKEGISLMSIGFIAGEDAPVVWRGPLLGQAVQQFLERVEWGDLDYLLIDMPPGTGDVPLTLSQSVELSGALIVTTPQGVALEDVERGIGMFQRVEVEILGLVENMSYYLCPKCDERHELFGKGGGRDTAMRLGLEFLGELPMTEQIRTGGDAGRPAVLEEGQTRHFFEELAQKLVAGLKRLETEER